MNILFISTEAAPFAKSGGLGDVIGSLPKELLAQGIDVRVMLPLYRSIKQNPQYKMNFLRDFTLMLSWRTQYCGIFEMKYEGVTFYFLDNEQYFGRDAYYGYDDDGERFAYYSKAALDVLPYLDFTPDILHCSEWQTALVPVYLKTLYKGKPEYDRLKTVFTIHNIEYQGKFDGGILQDLLGISEEYRGILDYNGGMNYMKGAIVTCDKLTTVSPTYSEEILYPFYGKGLETIIQENQYKLSGILNGIDTKAFNPAQDNCLWAKYSKNTYIKKHANKSALQEKLGLWQNEDTPILAMIGRLTEHKGIDLVIRVFDELMAENVQFVLLGTGEEKYEAFFKEKARQYGDRISVTIGFSGELANQIYAGADLFLMPSISEPCGLAQMISLRYGTIPIVRETGGLKDSIKAYDAAAGKGNGVTFATVNAQDMLGAVKRALSFYQNKDQWERLVKNGMATDFSWKKSAKEYIKIYHSCLD
ncbi:glycogen synthase GlgA [Sinanaerobacter chloroacetimidivorans]|jgi:starch synthase|uniref:Glycogen synthase n=1 Tax=Sinanaerobacter chloroacetimidivorans TaxID=2818044 RepID=A0A8J7VZQ8_9FIRM|nr:glycogen synthase GlgA [Sinanaerobacter chloroacetimidivorans]MBR0596521.1 glycogen synthase GlgA [Sinanaerobacter chloroacetimidivorans]